MLNNRPTILFVGYSRGVKRRKYRKAYGTQVQLDSGYSPRLCNIFNALKCCSSGSTSLPQLLSHLTNASIPLGNPTYHLQHSKTPSQRYLPFVATYTHSWPLLISYYLQLFPFFLLLCIGYYILVATINLLF